MLAPPHPREAERLLSLNAYDILDTVPESEFDDIVALAAEICGLPISLISLVDADRQWFKAKYNFEASQTPRRNAVCGHAILREDDYLEIEDTLQDPRTEDNEICMSDPNIRFYAGAVLRTQDDMPIGTLCVLGNTPNTLNDFQRRALKTLARSVMNQLELKKTIYQAEQLSQEADHRVKNSLATIAAIVRTYSSRMDIKNPRAAFAAIESRISAVALLHEELQKATDGHNIRLDRYVQNIGRLLEKGLPENVYLEMETEPMSGRSEIATALGIIVNEFVSNSVKHAFPDGRRGQINIKFYKADTETILQMSDNGVGNVAAPSPKTDIESLGERLMQSAAANLNSNLETKRDVNGCHLKLIFELT